MPISSVLPILVYMGIIALLTKPIGLYMAKVFQGESVWLSKPLGWLERGIYKVLGIDPSDEQSWKKYASEVILFSLVSMLFSYAMLRLQGMMPLNSPGHGPAQMTSHLAFNTAASFMSNTNWQSYSPELAVTMFSNMVALAIHNWASAAVGMAVAVAFIRGLSSRSADGLGNFWADTVRATLYILLPLAFVGALVFVASGVPQNFLAPQVVTTLEGAKQTLQMGPIASQEVIKQLGTNGGGFFNTNSAHPFENPTPWSDLFTKILIFLIPAGLTYTFGRLVGNVRQGWAIFGAMAFLFLAGAFVGTYAEEQGNPAFAKYGVELTNMEGKEARFGIAASTLFASVTTGASCGAVNAMHDSFLPIAGLVPTFNMLTGEVIFGGVGAGLYGMLIFAILSVFIAGLMVGRTPEYLGKKVGRFEVQTAMVTVLVLAASTLGFTAIASVLDLPKEGAAAAINTFPGSAYGGSDSAYGAMTGNLNNGGAHGFTEMFYAFTSATANNGSAFAGITANTPIYNTLLGIAMIVGRFFVIIPVLAIAGHMSRKKITPTSSGTLPTDSLTFAGLLVGIVIIVGALTYFPALALGPAVEHLQMTGAK